MESDPRALSVQSVKKELRALRQGPSLAHPTAVLRLSVELRGRLLGMGSASVTGSDNEVVQILHVLRTALDKLSPYDRLHLAVDFNLAAEHSFPTLTARQESLASSLSRASKTVRRHADFALDTLALVIVTGSFGPSTHRLGAAFSDVQSDSATTKSLAQSTSKTKQKVDLKEERAALVFGAAAWDLSCYIKDLPASSGSVQAYAFEERPGGKGLNQAVGIARLGKRVRLLCPIGGDVAAAEILTFLAAENVETDSIEVRQGSVTPRAVVLTTRNGLYHHIGWKNEYEIYYGNRFLDSATVRRAIETATVILVTFEPARDDVRAIFRTLASSVHRPVIVTASPPIEGEPLSGSDLRLIDYLIVNDWELRYTLRHSDSEEFRSDDVVNNLLNAGVGVICVIDSNRCRVYGISDSFVELLSVAIAFTDESASKDAFAAALASRIVESGTASEDDFQFAYYAMIAAGMRFGTSSSLPTQSEIKSVQELVSKRTKLSRPLSN